MDLEWYRHLWRIFNLQYLLTLRAYQYRSVVDVRCAQLSEWIFSYSWCFKFNYGICRVSTLKFDDGGGYIDFGLVRCVRDDDLFSGLRGKLSMSRGKYERLLLFDLKWDSCGSYILKNNFTSMGGLDGAVLEVDAWVAIVSRDEMICYLLCRINIRGDWFLRIAVFLWF